MGCSFEPSRQGDLCWKACKLQLSSMGRLSSLRCRNPQVFKSFAAVLNFQVSHQTETAVPDIPNTGNRVPQDTWLAFHPPCQAHRDSGSVHQTTSRQRSSNERLSFFTTRRSNLKLQTLAQRGWRSTTPNGVFASVQRMFNRRSWPHFNTSEYDDAERPTGVCSHIIRQIVPFKDDSRWQMDIPIWWPRTPKGRQTER